MTANSMLAEARKSLGISGRPNEITRWYSKRNGNEFLTAPFCDMGVTKWSYFSGNYDAVCFGKDYAYTVWHAQMFQQAGQWHWGSSGARPGDVIFFQWEGGSASLGKIDHVGVVEKNLGGGRIQTIEANTGNAVLRRVRSGNIITGYGRPNYGQGGGSGASDRGNSMSVIGTGIGDKGEEAKYVQLLVVDAGREKDLGKSGVDGEYGKDTAEAVRLTRKDVGSAAKKGFGDVITAYALRQLEQAAQLNLMRKKGLTGGSGGEVNLEGATLTAKITGVK